MAIVVGDIHGDLAMTRAFLSYKPEAEHVSLGDIVDSRDPLTPFDEELACLDLLLDSDCVLVWGNHDLAYTPERPWGDFTRHGRINDPEVQAWIDDNQYLASIFEKNRELYCRDIFESRYHLARQKDQVKAAHAAGGWLCTHAGVSTALTAALPSAPWGSADPSAIASWICEEFEREFATKARPWHESLAHYGKGPLFCRDWTRGGEDSFGGIFWYDPQWEPSHPPDPRFKQIFGHTKVAGPMRKGNHVNIHIEDGWWVFDTETEGFVRLGP
ncbi:metallophosphoesterase [Oryzomonas sagensis]|uniref:Metallophosphoesterase n=1 Tax=Oryzomonas sagensis TaxID=2603857 RepID=A0ABQ6TL87_9BACT|nr:metallophosphoesterase family protein [Oryzomonas sagensis]KAB0669037.1 metallophosphoesterase [Oryzomonas sagensis]